MDEQKNKELARLSTKLYHRLEKKYDRVVRKRISEQIIEQENLLKKSLEKIDTMKLGTSLKDFVFELQKDITELQNAADDLERPFRLFVIGTGNTGKSTLINALIGKEQEFAKTNRIPDTWKIDIYKESSDDVAELRFIDGTTRSMTTIEARYISDEEEKKGRSARRELKVGYEKIDARQDWSETAKKEAKKKLEREKGYKMEIAEAFWPVSGSMLLQHFQLVDTPGIDQNLWGRSVNACAKEYYEKADGILWVLPADKISEKASALELNGVSGQFVTRMENTIVVVNKMDKIQENDPVHGCEDIMAETKQIYGNLIRRIQYISAKKAVHAIKSQDKIMLQKSGLPELLDAIRTSFLQRAQKIQLERIDTQVKGILIRIQEKISGISDEMIEKKQCYEKLGVECQEAFVREKRNGEKEIELVLQKEIERIIRNIQAYAKELEDLEKDEQERFLRDKILEYDFLEMTVNNLAAQKINYLRELSEMYSDKVSFSEYKALEKAMNVTNDKGIICDLGIDKNVFSTTGGQAVVGGATALAATVLLGPIGLAAGLVALTPMGRSVAKMLRGWFGKSIATELEEKYREVFKNIEDRWKESFNAELVKGMERVYNRRNHTFFQRYADPSLLFDIFQKLDDMYMIAEKDLKNVTIKDMLLQGERGSI